MQIVTHIIIIKKKKKELFITHLFITSKCDYPLFINI